MWTPALGREFKKMNKKIFVFIITIFSFLFFSCKKKQSLYDLCLNSEINDKYSVYEYCFGNDKSKYQNFISSTYNKAEKFYDLKKYENAIYNYKEVLVAFACENSLPSFNIAFEETAKNYEIRYFSLYNIACCYSLLGKLNDAELFLIRAIESGYPYINHIMTDDDLSNLFNSNTNLKQKVNEIYNKGNIENTLVGQEIKLIRGPSGGCSFNFLTENTVVYETHSEGAPKYNDKYYGTYTLKNYFVVISFSKEEYGDMSNSEAYYKDILENNYKKVSLKIKEEMVLPLAIKENNFIANSEL